MKDLDNGIKKYINIVMLAGNLRILHIYYFFAQGLIISGKRR